MIIKKYQGTTEAEATAKAREELGQDAVIMNVKSVKQKGLRKLFKKSYYEVTAAIDEPSEKAAREKHTASENKARKPVDTSENLKETVSEKETTEAGVKTAKTSAIEERLDNLAQLLEQQIQETKEEEAEERPDQKSKLVKLVYEQLLDNEVTEENAREIMSEIDNKSSEIQVDDLLSNIYQKIVLKLGQIKTIELCEKKPKVVFFVGPTGVGKTTTIAKLASKYKLDHKCKLAIITADTYRVAAVEQIRTYANILNVPIEVVYSAEELQQAIQKYAEYDLLFVDTAGRSHQNQEQQEDVKRLLQVAKEYEQEIYLVISATTKYRDLVKITQVYSDISSYRLLFTKTDETGALGNILNIKMLTNEPLSYVTFGQNVPDDIEITDAQAIAKQLLGGSV